MDKSVNVFLSEPKYDLEIQTHKGKKRNYPPWTQTIKKQPD